MKDQRAQQFEREQECLCSAQTLVNYGTCMCLVQGIFYHCTNEDVLLLLLTELGRPLKEIQWWVTSWSQRAGVGASSGAPPRVRLGPEGGARPGLSM